jgi:hypothetical protein
VSGYKLRILRTHSINQSELPRGLHVKCRVREGTGTSRSNGVSYGKEEKLEDSSAYNSFCKPTRVERITTKKHNISCTHTNPLLEVTLPRVMVEIYRAKAGSIKVTDATEIQHGRWSRRHCKNILYCMG